MPPQLLVASLSVPPLSVSASEATATFSKSRVAPGATTVAPAAEPSAFACATFKVPELTVVSPVKLLLPESVTVPPPSMVRPKPPEMVPDSVRLEPAEASIVLSAVSAIGPAKTPLRIRPPAKDTGSVTDN